MVPVKRWPDDGEVIMQKRKTRFIALGCLLLLSSCDLGLGDSVIVVNSTDQPLFIDDSKVSKNGGRWNYGFSGCGQADLVFLDAAGEEYVRIDTGWCAGETWTITGRDEVSLEDADN